MKQDTRGEARQGKSVYFNTAQVSSFKTQRNSGHRPEIGLVMQKIGACCLTQTLFFPFPIRAFPDIQPITFFTYSRCVKRLRSNLHLESLKPGATKSPGSTRQPPSPEWSFDRRRLLTRGFRSPIKGCVVVSSDAMAGFNFLGAGVEPRLV